MTSGYYLDKGYQSHLQIWGEHGWLRFSSIEQPPWNGTAPGHAGPGWRPTLTPRGEGLPALREGGVRARAGLEDAPVTGEEGLHVLRSIFAFYEAVKTGKTQPVG